MKRRLPILLFALLLVLDVSAFLVDKAASQHAGQHAGAAELGSFYVRVVTQPWIWMLAIIGPTQLWAWTRILRKVDLSLAYPISSLSYPATMIAAQIIFGERLSVLVWIGAAIMTLGIAVLGSHPNEPAVPPVATP